MPSIPTRSPWDFSDALELLHSTLEKRDLPVLHEDAKLDTTSVRRTTGLGDFSRLWQALGTTTVPDEDGDSRRLSVSIKDYAIPDPNRPPAPPPKEDTYASDGGYYSARKNVTWKDEPEYMDATDVPTTPTSDEAPAYPLSSTFRGKDVAQSQNAAAEGKKEAKRAKKQRQKQKKLAEQHKQEKARTRKVVSDIESESELGKHVKLTPASRASRHWKASAGVPSAQGRRKAESNQDGVSQSDGGNAAPTVSSDSPARGKHRRGRSKDTSHSNITPSTPKKPVVIFNHLPSTLPPQPAAKLPPTPTQQLSRSLQSQFATNNLPMHLPVITNPTPTATQPARPQFQILAKEERDLQLFLRLIHEFGDDKIWLTRPVPMADHHASPSGIHVFVDFSNIWIGFMDHLKQMQAQMHQPIPHQNISFDALVLLLERKRPVTKRVLAGSYPLLPAMESAKQIGYETLILEKVYKSRELTERQRRMLALQSRNAFAALGKQGASNTFPATGVASTPPSNSSSFALSPEPEKWVEQGVDEILHLKMLESLVDSTVPSRMVVATGDAAEAEYSEGFMKMIVRALQKGWHVELVAFSKSISAAYWKKSFREEWGSRFRIVMLDGWAQFLLDT